MAIAGRVGRERVWDLAARVYPSDMHVPTVDAATRMRNERRLAALGIARRRTRAIPVEPVHVGEAGEPAVVEGVRLGRHLGAHARRGRPASVQPRRLAYGRERSFPGADGNIYELTYDPDHEDRATG
ncbi:MAG: hypothetical protein ABR593_01105 [Candidatus Limnocylindria bacterium]